MASITIETTRDTTSSNDSPLYAVDAFVNQIGYLRFWKQIHNDKDRKVECVNIRIKGVRGGWVFSDLSKRIVQRADMTYLQRMIIHSVKAYNHMQHVLDFSDLHVYLPRLRHLQVSRIHMRYLSNILPQLTHVQLSSVTLLDKDAPFCFSGNVQAIILNNSYCFEHHPIDLRHCRSLEVVDMFGCRLSVAPLLPMDGLLSFLNLSHNYLRQVLEFPDSLCKIIVSHNHLLALPDLPPQIAYLDFSRNPIKSMPSNILSCRRLKNLYFFNTEMELSILEMRYIGKIQERIFFDENTAYSDDQNVHNTFIQRSFVRSCEALFSDPVDPLIIYDGSLPKEVDLILQENFGLYETHVIVQCTFKEVFDRVWQRIQSVKEPATRHELIQRLVDELIDGHQKCFTGKISRLLNCLVGYFDDINIQIGDADQVRAKIIQHMKRHQGVINETVLFHELQELEMDPKTIREWITSYQEYGMDF